MADEKNQLLSHSPVGHFFMDMKKAEGIIIVMVTDDLDRAKQPKRQYRMQNDPVRIQEKKAGGISSGL